MTETACLSRDALSKIVATIHRLFQHLGLTASARNPRNRAG